METLRIIRLKNEKLHIVEVGLLLGQGNMDERFREPRSCGAYFRARCPWYNHSHDGGVSASKDNGSIVEI
ncbi:hypothetical protein SUGI_0113340 [Cryptomeria japonica]|nr:hypothetical protein SUGI_0113340 [Cryptomeria japonica]